MPGILRRNQLPLPPWREPDLRWTGGFWLNYTVPGVEFGERVIERLAVYLPLALGNLDAGLYLAEVILGIICRRSVTRPTVERQRRSKRAVTCSATGQQHKRF